MPVRIELRDRETKRTCNITLSYSFIETPVKGDYIIVNKSALTVSGRCHYTDNGTARLVIITSSLEVSRYDDMLMILDWFKENYEIQSIESDTQPENYYSLYRSIVALLDWRDVASIDFRQKPVIIKFVNAAVAILMIKCNMSADLAFKQCKPWGDLLTLMILEKNQLDDFRIISIIKEWQKKLQQLTVIDDDWVINAQDCVDNLRYVERQGAGNG